MEPIPDNMRGRVSYDLRYLTEALVKSGADAGLIGALGGQYDYGVDFENSIFAMRQFDWDMECDCGFEDATAEASQYANREAGQWDIDRDLTLWNTIYAASLSRLGWDSHTHLCRLETPNFHHFSSDTKVSFYKYIGRGMEWNRAVTTPQAWSKVFFTCLSSVEGV